MKLGGSLSNDQFYDYILQKTECFGSILAIYKEHKLAQIAEANLGRRPRERGQGSPLVYQSHIPLPPLHFPPSKGFYRLICGGDYLGKFLLGGDRGDVSAQYLRPTKH
jgi:hypothetical protein